MKTLACSVLTLAIVAVAAVSASAATLTYDGFTGKAVLDPTDGGTNPTGKIFGYNLASNAKFFVDPARTSAFPAPAPTFFENTASVIGDNDFSFQGTAATINLGQLFVTKAASKAEVEANFTNRIYVGGLGGGELQIPVNFIIPEPATAGLAGLCLVGLAALRRRSA